MKNIHRRPDKPSENYRFDESEADRLPEPKVETDTSDDEDNVMVNSKYDGSVTLDVVLSGFWPKIIPLMQGGEDKGFAHLGDLSHMKHVVVVVGPFSSGTNAMCEYLGRYFDVAVLPPRHPLNASGWIGDMSEEGYQARQNNWQVSWKHMPPLTQHRARQDCFLLTRSSSK